MEGKARKKAQPYTPKHLYTHKERQYVELNGWPAPIKRVRTVMTVRALASKVRATPNSHVDMMVVWAINRALLGKKCAPQKQPIFVP